MEYEALCAAIAELVPWADTSVLPPARTVELPCCYDPEVGLDLAAAAERLGLGIDDDPHSFGGGIPHLLHRVHARAALHEHARAPAHPSARHSAHESAGGGVGIGGAQCCIYSVESPGGYWILGRTPLRLYDPDAAEPTLLRPGDRVRFRPISSLEGASTASMPPPGPIAPAKPVEHR